MAVGKGKIVSVAPRAGARQPQYSVSLRAGAAAFYELPSPKPPVRTIMRWADASLRVSRPFTQEDREPIRIFHRLDQRTDARAAVFGLIGLLADVSIRGTGETQGDSDIRVTVTHPLHCRGDTAQYIGARLYALSDLQQTIFIVLLDESHVIAT